MYSMVFLPSHGIFSETKKASFWGETLIMAGTIMFKPRFLRSRRRTCVPAGILVGIRSPISDESSESDTAGVKDPDFKPKLRDEFRCK
jgi:hypothetical protein